MRRFWTMLAHMHGQIWNASELGRAMGLSDKTVRNYLDELSQTFMVRQLRPWFENIGKRQVKSPKIYLRDSGILHHLIGLETESQLHAHPKVGSSWEGFALEQTLAALRSRDAYFWATHAGAELDLMVLVAGRRVGFEFKHSDAPALTASMRAALADLGLDHLWVVYPGNDRYPLSAKSTVIPVQDIPAIARGGSGAPASL